MNKRINILFLINKFDIGGVQKVNVRMLNNIDTDKFNVHVLYIKEGVLKKDITNPEIKFVKMGEELKSYVNIKYIFKTIKYVKQNNIDAIHTIDPTLYMVGATAAHFTKIKHIRSQPNLIRTHERLNTKTLKILPFERWTDRYITFNESTKKDLNLAGVSLEKISVIYSYAKINEAIDQDNYENIREKIGVPENKKIVCSIGRLVKGKGLETFIKMVPFVIEDYNEVIFLVVGDGPLREELIQMCKEIKIEKYVYFLGFSTDIPNIVRQVTLGVYATDKSAGMVDIPRCGKVLISRESEIMGEYIIDGETGILIDSDEPEDYANSVLKLLNNEKLLEDMESNIKEFFINKFDGDKNMRKFENLVFDLVKNA
ncbi:glycosyltransferase [Anaerosalibacter sp. Marseille-P3206]|uniref:glycosyltransferase n=1 Tax=Anaerosalibacter sp. Marseille-P3206 TaxID=1871005 RepID=UPI00098427C3|nr:glycosyltransferase [Anaerosalibacter sp. Marseille-P3206]